MLGFIQSLYTVDCSNKYRPPSTVYRLPIKTMLAKIGKYAKLEVVKILSFGAYLDGGHFGEILLPTRYVPEGTEIDDEIEVFLYCDSEDRLIATTLKPYATTEEFAFLKCVHLSEYGAFLEWGIAKHLFVPFREQGQPMEVDRSYVVYIYLDESTERIAASARLNRHVKNIIAPNSFVEGDTVDLLIAKKTPLGYKTIVNGLYWGQLYKNDVFRNLKVGDKVKGYIKTLRPDGKIDLTLRKQGYQAAIPEAAHKIMAYLKENDGFVAVTDKSPPDAIYAKFQMSKKAFKKAIGGLYKRKMIRIEKDGIHLVEVAE